MYLSEKETMTQENLFDANTMRGLQVPYISSPVERTEGGVYYFRRPSVALLTRPSTDLRAALPFLHSFEQEPDFPEYAKDPVSLPDGEALAKFAGQTCYLSFGSKRTVNADADRYFRNILESGHGSVLEHVQYAFLFWGISRSLTHELVRHRAGFGFSQVSQRYVDGGRLRFVMRPEFSEITELEEMFFEEIEMAFDNYNRVRKLWGEYLSNKLSPEQRKQMSPADWRKIKNQVARTFLPNCTEAPIVVSMNLRALRHFLNMRGSIHAETEIRYLSCCLYELMRTEAPNVLQDIDFEDLPDGSSGLHLQFPKV